MKVIKLNRRYKLFKEHGYEAGVRFDSWGNRAREIEITCRDRLGYSWNQESSEWYRYFGKRPANGPTPYFIMFRKESNLSFILLCADLTKKD
jgi:hypothetical protein